jgi:hypothetical protein
VPKSGGIRQKLRSLPVRVAQAVAALPGEQKVVGSGLGKVWKLDLRSVIAEVQSPDVTDSEAHKQEREMG